MSKNARKLEKLIEELIQISIKEVDDEHFLKIHEIASSILEMRNFL
jgi:hypothetical protein